jgi:hypothetical protein
MKGVTPHLFFDLTVAYPYFNLSNNGLQEVTITAGLISPTPRRGKIMKIKKVAKAVSGLCKCKKAC